MATLSIKNIQKTYESGEKSLFDCTFNVHDKELLVIVGPEGSGKSTLVRMIAGLEEIGEGDVFLGGKSIKDVPPKERDIAMISQSNSINPNLTVYDNLAFGLKLRKASEEEIEMKVNAVASLFGLTDLLQKKTKTLSAHQKQRIMVGRCVAREPKLFLFDDPLAGLDGKLRMQMRSEIVKLHARIASTFVYSTRDQVEAMTLGTRLVVMKDGFIQQIDTPQNLYDYPVNLFVAEYFGMPKMNEFRDVTLFTEEGKTYASLPGGNKVALPGTVLARIKDLESYVDTGKKLILGIRPEDIHEDQLFLSTSPDTVVHAKVDIVEKLGSESRVHCMFESDEMFSDTMIAKVSNRSTLERGDTAEFALDIMHVQLFDEDEMSILSRDENYKVFSANAESTYVPPTAKEMIEMRKVDKKKKK